MKQAVYEMYRNPKPGDLLMDTPKVKPWRELVSFACDKEYWKARVRSMRQQPVVSVDMVSGKVCGSRKLGAIYGE